MIGLCYFQKVFELYRKKFLIFNMPFIFISALPTTPVSLPYGTAVTTTYSGPSVPSIKTLTQSASMGSRDISVGHQIIQNKPHPTFPGIRTVSLSPFFINDKT